MGRPTDRRTLVLGANVYDYGTDAGAWRAPGEDPLRPFRAEFWRDTARTAERAGLDAVFLADTPGLSSNPAIRPMRQLEPLAALAVVAAETEHLGAIATVSTSTTDPVELSRRLLSFGAFSGGRFGWNVVTGVTGPAVADFGFTAPPGRDDRYARAEEFVDAVAAFLAAVRDDTDYRHDGPLFAARIPRDRLGVDPAVRALLPDAAPLVVQAGGSPRGRALAARSAEAVFAAETVHAGALANAEDLRRRAAALGRPAPLILPGIHLVVGSTEAEAEERFTLIHERGPEGNLLRRFSAMFGIDGSRLDLDAPAEEELARLATDPEATPVGFRTAIAAYGAAGGLSVRQLLRYFAGFGHQLFVGTPERLADIMTEWLDSGAADGFNLLFDTNPWGLREFADHVTPVLRARGLLADAPGAPFARRMREARR
ncbi:LLM class flavin-dependent oxidoreductase [Mycetocola reblochoni]|uniref:LLM class flavin-dependent oxidoreductase n=2 Tax=Mycetocola reblochoni TaxID=331618 RepID=A0A3L6ZSI7_9MICO|nr:LLM class flavin-dependent oxidoreductase [Mycetocola reblochoni]RLP70913.1 LLM class flavin-dependent oxidoreductase [Mycetocola reblochoni]SJN24561.1 probable nitrilotriacetate monooxygenase, component A [Mycetocola reblochoni REB411]